MDERLDPRTIEEIDRIDWITRRQLREEEYLARALALRDSLNGYTFSDDDQRLNYMYDSLMELDRDSPYINRSVRIDGYCAWQGYDSQTGRARLVGRMFVDTQAIDRGMTVLERDYADGDIWETKYVIGHLLELADETGDTRYVVAPLKDTQLVYDPILEDYENVLKSVLPLDMFDMFWRMTAVSSDEEVAKAVGLLARMRIDCRHISSSTMGDLSEYVAGRLAISDQTAYMIAINEHLLVQEDGYSKVVPRHPQVQAVKIKDTLLAPSIDGDDWRWFFQVENITTGGIYSTEGEWLVPLSSIEALRILPDDEDSSAV